MTALGRPTPRSRFAILASAACLSVGALALVMATGHGATPTRDQTRPVSAREAARGFTDTPTVPQVLNGTGYAATPRPETPPPLIRAAGACKHDLDKIRDLLDADPYGMTASTRTRTRLNAELANLRRADTCSSETTNAFTIQEVMPWMTWTAPTATPTAASTAAASSTRSSSAAPAEARHPARAHRR